MAHTFIADGQRYTISDDEVEALCLTIEAAVHAGGAFVSVPPEGLVRVLVTANTQIRIEASGSVQSVAGPAEFDISALDWPDLA